MIKLYSKRNCAQCTATKVELDSKGIQYETISLDDTPEEIQPLVDKGFRSLPVVITDNDSWDGFRPDKIKELQNAKV